MAPSGQGILFPVKVRWRSAQAGGKLSYAKIKISWYPFAWRRERVGCTARGAVCGSLQGRTNRTTGRVPLARSPPHA